MKEMAEKEFRRGFDRSVLRRFALRMVIIMPFLKRKRRFIFGLKPRVLEPCFNMIVLSTYGFLNGEEAVGDSDRR
jgi:hypothetical protein